ncbi:hypothetical protein KUW17_13400 [Leisingera aquaemixtae]|uniref:hypothetical protein n=1 Tax=Leisingera TaxID=191028 RepID=UPI001C95F457|nr:MULTISPECIES: hypothetical protein [Leisingera]MBY6067747.1 hypothetical protein [Leisingera aquaemixtae]MCB4456704.1 hypothetical protein [Leisingera sp. McT4-56]
MDTDLALILGLVLAGLSVPAALSAASEQRPPRFPAVAILAAIGLIGYAVGMNPGGYSLADIPEAFFRVAGQLF